MTPTSPSRRFPKSAPTISNAPEAGAPTSQPAPQPGISLNRLDQQLDALQTQIDRRTTDQEVLRKALGLLEERLDTLRNEIAESYVARRQPPPRR